MSWRERFGGGDERAEVAARARALLTTAGVTARAAPALAPVPPPVDAPAAFFGSHLPPPVAPTVASTAAPVVAPVVAPVAPTGTTRGGWVPGQPVGFGDFALPAASAHAGAGATAAPDSREVDDDGSAGHGLADAVVGARALDGDLPEPVDDGRGRHARHRIAADRAAALTVAATPWRERIRLDPGRRGLVAVAAVVVVIASVAGGVLFRGGPSSAVTVATASGLPGASAAPVEGDTAAAAPSVSGSRVPSDASGPAASGPAASGSASGTVTVDVAGLVAAPGVYTLPAGSRVEDALTAAGGALPGADLSAVNRARVLVDGEQLAVGVPGAVAPVSGPAAGTAGGSAGGGLIDLNTAGLADLDTLPGVGPVLAQAILDWRADHGTFASVGDLDQVTGIGPATFAKLKDLVTV